MKKLALLLTAVLVLSVGCASMQPDLTPSQRLYALVSEYEALQCIAADYCESSTAEPGIKASIKNVDIEIMPAILRIHEGSISIVEDIKRVEGAICRIKFLLELAKKESERRRA